MNPLDIIAIGLKLVDKLTGLTPDQKSAIQMQMMQLQSSKDLAELAADTDLAKAGAQIVNTEAQSSSWLTRNWRPITMLVLLSLVVARWFGFAATNLNPNEYTQLWNLVQIGIGGYIGGRTIEKIAPTVASAFSASKQPN